MRIRIGGRFNINRRFAKTAVQIQQNLVFTDLTVEVGDSTSLGLKHTRLIILATYYTQPQTSAQP